MAQAALLILCCGAPWLPACDEHGGTPSRSEAVTAQPGHGGAPSQVRVHHQTPERPQRAAAPSASASASATPSASASSGATHPPGLLGAIAGAAHVRITVVDPRGSSAHITLSEPERMDPLLAAVGLDQRPASHCPRCLPAITLVFEDRFGTRLGSVATGCTVVGVPNTVGLLHDPLEQRCERLVLAHPATIDAIARRVKAPRGAPAASAAR